MSTDDLTRRARAWATQPLLHEHYGAALVSELADEVDRRKAERDAEAHAKVTALNALISALEERDAARAALERVQAIAETAELAAPFGKPPYWTGHILNALEGES